MSNETQGTTRRIIELCAYNIQSGLNAEKGGASRIELCTDAASGGITPNYGLLDYVANNIKIPVYVMIRPRGGNFIYDNAELEIMQKDISICKELRFAGVVFGVLTRDNSIDTEQMKRFVDMAYPMGVTCHKAFDKVTDGYKALEDVISAGCERILTSGLQPTALSGAGFISELITMAANRITIMPGGGVRSENLQTLVHNTYATEFHSSALISKSNDSVADINEIKALVRILHNN